MTNIDTKQKTTVEVVAVDTHTHEGKPCKKGDKIQVTAEQKKFLLEQKIPVLEK